MGWSVADLRHLAALALESDLANAEELSRIDAFCDAVNQWLQSQVSLEGKEVGKEIQELVKEHALVLERVAQLKKEATTEMLDFRKKSKAILSYIDQFPRRAGMLRNKKG